MRKFNRYKQNLTQQGDKIWSYSTHVATIKGDELHQLGWWSVTTQKHINYVAKELNLKLIK
jgi:fructose 1,6-bisphosphatase|tara:strand:- start:1973 stop:2155 length:183 start_codon:yes stop_codon:yes gene_type:complete